QRPSQARLAPRKRCQIRPTAASSHERHTPVLRRSQHHIRALERGGRGAEIGHGERGRVAADEKESLVAEGPYRRIDRAQALAEIPPGLRLHCDGASEQSRRPGGIRRPVGRDDESAGPGGGVIAPYGTADATW